MSEFSWLCEAYSYLIICLFIVIQAVREVNQAVNNNDEEALTIALSNKAAKLTGFTKENGSWYMKLLEEKRNIKQEVFSALPWWPWWYTHTKSVKQQPHWVIKSTLWYLYWVMCSHFLLFQWICLAADHTSENAPFMLVAIFSFTRAYFQVNRSEWKNNVLSWGNFVQLGQHCNYAQSCPELTLF